MGKMDADKTIEQFIIDYQFRLAPRTIKIYKRAVKQLQEHLGKSFDTITKKDIRRWLLLLEEKGYKPNTIMGYLIGLKTFYKYCLEEGHIQLDPASEIPFPKQEEKIPQYLTKDQLTQLRNHVKGKLLERAIIEVLYATGMRISELREMKKQDIDWLERSILIPEGKWKKGRIVLFSLECAEHLRTYLDSRTEDDLPYVFVIPNQKKYIGGTTISKRFASCSEQLGFKVTPHMLRHTFAAHLAQKGMPLESIRILLGHESQHTTQLYARLFNKARKEMYDHWM
ncbi:tyrosine-type recombinase/integrase [Ureibacillus composti]